MFTENFSLNGLTSTFIRQGVVRTIRFDEGTATGGVTPLIRVTSLQGSKVDFEMKPGRIINLSEPLNGIVIRNASTGANITGKISYGDGQVTDNTTTGSVDLNTNTIQALITAAYTTRPEAPNGTHNTVGAMAVNTPVQVLAPASNLNGLIVLNCDMSDSSASYLRLALLGKASPPANMQDGDPILVAGPIYSANSNPTTLRERLQNPVFVPAGLGLYFISETGTTAGCMKTVRWKTL